MYSCTLCFEKLDHLSMIFFRSFYIRRCSFSRAIFWCNKICGGPPILRLMDRNTWRNEVFLVRKYLIDSFLIHIMVSAEAWEIHGLIEEEMLFLLVRVIIILMVEIMKLLDLYWKYKKMSIFPILYGPCY